MAGESKFEKHLIKRIMSLYPGAIILKNDSSYFQGFPDRLLLYERNWAAFEIKDYENAPKQPNQEYYVELLNKMSYAEFVFPENEERFLNGLQRSFRPSGSTRVFKR